jgi:hypothetical protein
MRYNSTALHVTKTTVNYIIFSTARYTFTFYGNGNGN